MTAMSRSCRCPARPRIALLCLLGAGPGACADDPVYIQPEAAVEVVPGEGAAAAQLTLPIRLEREAEATERAARAAELGIEVPYVRRDDLDLSVEWTIKNLDAEPGVARIQLNGANEFFAYVPIAFVVDPEEEETPPPLSGDVPLDIAGSSTRSGVFQEDLLAEASLDLELITRGGVSPFTALLVDQETLRQIEADGAVIPSDAFASLVRFDLTVVADHHMVLEFAVRVRDHRDPPLLHDDLTSAPPDELTTFAPADFAPAAP